MKRLAIIAAFIATSAHAQVYYGGSAHVGGTGFGVQSVATAPAPDLSSQVVAWWSLDESGDADRVPDGGSCSTDCTLIKSGDAGGISSITGIEGTAAYDRTASATSNSKHSCAIATCDELFPSVGSNFTFGCWANPDDATPTTAGNPFIAGTTGGGYFTQNRTDGKLSCEMPSISAAVTTGAVYADATWLHASCVYTNATTSIEAFVNGDATGATAIGVYTAPVATNAAVGQGPGNGGGFTGAVDECFVAFAAWNEAQLCHVASCGIDGTAGPCLCGVDGSYVDNGRYTTRSLTCTLPSNGCLTGGF